jgi:hypothetical protein
VYIKYNYIIPYFASKNPKIPGLGNWGGRIVSNAGAILLSSENSFTDFDQNTIIVEEKKSETSRFGGASFALEILINIGALITAASCEKTHKVEKTKTIANKPDKIRFMGFSSFCENILF